MVCIVGSDEVFPVAERRCTSQDAIYVARFPRFPREGSRSLLDAEADNEAWPALRLAEAFPSATTALRATRSDATSLACNGSPRVWRKMAP